MEETVLGWVEGGHVGVFGWDSDKDAAIAFPDGSFQIRDGINKTVGFELTKDPTNYTWQNAEGYLPCLETRFCRGSLNLTISNYADLVEWEGNRYVVAFSRIEVENKGTQAIEIDPGASPEFIALTEEKKQILPGTKTRFDYAIAIDRFATACEWIPANVIQDSGNWDEHYTHMKAYWDERLSEVASVRTPFEKLNNAYKAGYIYTHIVKDGSSLKVGENGYDGVWDHDAIGILATLLTIGCHKEAKDLLEALPTGFRYDDATWKYAWPWAIYLQKTGDRALVERYWDRISKTAHQIALDRTGKGRTMKETEAIDTFGFWTIDNWSAMTGLLAYRYLAARLGKTDESKWAAAEYRDLLSSSNAVLSETLKTHQLNYIPASLIEPNTENRCREAGDANWAAHFLFGRWAWDGWLLGAIQDGTNFDLIDATYDYGFKRLQEDGLPKGTFGGYPANWGKMYCSSYNAGYGSAALRGKKHRSVGVEAYLFHIENCQSGPNSYWEDISAPEPGEWQGTHPKQGNGSCPHMWGQSVATKVLIDSIVAEFFDGRLIVGRGVPEDWLNVGPVVVSRYPISGGRINVRMSLVKSGEAAFEFSGDVPKGDIILSLPCFIGSVKGASVGKIDKEEGTVTVPGSTHSVTVKFE
jgi:hypothetical protein